MKFELEPSDISAIAETVLRKLTPLLNDLKRAAVQNMPTPVIQNSKPKDHTQEKSDIVSSKELPLITGLSRTTIWRMENEKKFPARRHLSENRVGWLRDEVNSWLAARKVVMVRQS